MQRAIHPQFILAELASSHLHATNHRGKHEIVRRHCPPWRSQPPGPVAVGSRGWLDFGYGPRGDQVRAVDAVYATGAGGRFRPGRRRLVQEVEEEEEKGDLFLSADAASATLHRDESRRVA